VGNGRGNVGKNRRREVFLEKEGEVRSKGVAGKVGVGWQMNLGRKKLRRTTEKGEYFDRGEGTVGTCGSDHKN